MTYHVLVAVDGTPASNTALELAGALADSYEATLDLITVPNPKRVSEDLIKAAEQEGVIQRRRGATASFEAEYAAYATSTLHKDIVHAEQASHVAGLVAEQVARDAAAYASGKKFQDVKSVRGSGDPANAILEAASKSEADIIIMGHDRHAPMASWFRKSVANKVQRHASCPVLIYCDPQ